MLGVGIGLGVGEFIGRRPGLAPKLDLNFASTKTLTASKGPTPSFSRASTGTYFNSSGVLTTAAINAARFNHTYNGTSWVSKGLLVEEQRTNIYLQSNNLNTSPWVQSNNTTTEGSATSPDGTSSASSIVPNTTNAAHYTYQVISTSATTYTLSFYAKANGYNFVQLSSGLTNDYVNFNLSAGSVANKSQSENMITSQQIQSAGNGWYRCSAIISSIGGSFDFGVTVINADTASRRPAFAGDGTSGILLYGFQMEAGSFATSLIPATTASTTRSADVCQITGSDFSGFYNQNEGSVVLEFDGAQSLPSPSPRNFPTYLAISKGNSGYDLETNSMVIFGQSDTNKIGVTASIDRATQYEMYSTGLFSPNMPQKSSFGYAVNNFGFTNNGENVLTDTSGTNPNQMAYLHLGKSSGGTFSCHIARLRYYNKRLPNATLQKLST